MVEEKVPDEAAAADPSPKRKTKRKKTKCFESPYVKKTPKAKSARRRIILKRSMSKSPGNKKDSDHAKNAEDTEDKEGNPGEEDPQLIV